jgi:hypothetical protein
MARYRFYLVNANDHFAGYRENELPDDAAAIQFGHSLLASSGPQIVAIEVWNHRVIVGRIARTDPAASGHNA